MKVGGDVHAQVVDLVGIRSCGIVKCSHDIIRADCHQSISLVLGDGGRRPATMLFCDVGSMPSRSLLPGRLLHPEPLLQTVSSGGRAARCGSPATSTACTIIADPGKARSHRAAGLTISQHFASGETQLSFKIGSIRSGRARRRPAGVSKDGSPHRLTCGHPSRRRTPIGRAAPQDEARESYIRKLFQCYLASSMRCDGYSLH